MKELVYGPTDREIANTESLMRIARALERIADQMAEDAEKERREGVRYEHG